MERQTKHSMKRRCFCHDYRERGIYMITLDVENRRPVLGRLVGEQIALTPLGKAVADCWRQIPHFHPEVKLLEFTVMPDHFHGLLFVRRKMACHLGEVVRGFKIGCTKIYRAQLNDTPTLSGEFAPGYHDSILTHKGQLETLFRYIRDNPRRLAARFANPDYFTRINALPLASATFAAYGNPFLLNRPDRIQIQCSRRITPDALASEKSRLLDAAERGAVLVSPCISPGENRSPAPQWKKVCRSLPSKPMASHPNINHPANISMPASPATFCCSLRPAIANHIWLATRQSPAPNASPSINLPPTSAAPAQPRSTTPDLSRWNNQLASSPFLVSPTGLDRIANVSNVKVLPLPILPIANFPP